MLATMVLLGISAWPIAPDRLPVHWNFSGDADGYGGKLEGLFLPVLLAIGLYLWMLIRPRKTSGDADPFTLPRVVVRTATVTLIFCLYLWLQWTIRTAT